MGRVDACCLDFVHVATSTVSEGSLAIITVHHTVANLDGPP